MQASKLCLRSEGLTRGCSHAPCLGHAPQPKAREMLVTLTPQALQTARSGRLTLDDDENNEDDAASSWGQADQVGAGGTAASAGPSRSGSAKASAAGTAQAGHDGSAVARQPSGAGEDGFALSRATSVCSKVSVPIGATCNLSVLILSDNPIGIGGAKVRTCAIQGKQPVWCWQATNAAYVQRTCSRLEIMAQA